MSNQEKKLAQATAFICWVKKYRIDTMGMSFEAFGNYLTRFIEYLLRHYGDLLTDGDRKKAEERLKGKLTEMVRGFEVESRYSEKAMNEAWRKLFMLFCITGDIESDFNIYDYLNSGDIGILPNNTWDRKEIPLIPPTRKQGSSGYEADLRRRTETLESQLAALSQQISIYHKKVETLESQLAALSQQISIRHKKVETLES